MPDNRASEFARKIQYEATIKTLGKKTTAEQLVTLVNNALSFTSKLADEIERKSGSLACQAGCSFCCYLMATVSAPEALVITRRLEESCSPEELQALKQKVKQAYHQTKEMDNLTRARAGIACPFLTAEGRCSIYAYRPLDCATHHSLSRQACEDLLEQPNQGHPTHTDLQAVGVGLKTGLGQGIAEVNLEQPAFRYELIEAIQIGLNDKRAMEKYLADQNLFRPAAIIIDGENQTTYKIKYAPPHLKAQAKRVITLERRQARRARRKG